METRQKFPANQISSIQIESKLSQINITEGQDGDIVLRWTDTKRRTTTAVQNGSLLSVSDKAPVTLYGIIGLIQLKQDKELTLELPSGFAGSIQISSRDEAVRALGLQLNGNLQIKTTTGAIEISAVKARSFDLTSSHGNISLRGITSDKGITATTIGSCIECTCAEDGTAYLLDCHSEQGTCSLPVTAYHGSKPLRLRSTTGTITVRFTAETAE